VSRRRRPAGRLEVEKGVPFRGSLLNSSRTGSPEVLKVAGVGVVGLDSSISISVGDRALN
jgi:hypothetical protein